MAIVLFDNAQRTKLFPLTATKAVADLRIGILKIKEYWQLVSKEKVFVHTADYLQCLYEKIPNEQHVWIDASIVPNEQLVHQILALENGTTLVDDAGLIAANLLADTANFSAKKILQVVESTVNTITVQRIEWPHDLFQLNDVFIRLHFDLITRGRTSQPISSTNQFSQSQNIFIEEGAVVEYALLNASTGSIYIGKNAVIMEGAVIRSSLALLDKAVIKMGAKIYGATTIGVQAVAGGEIKNAIISDFSNKAHDGYLGDSVLGEWCNLGAGTSNSNIKNTAGDVKLWNYFVNNYISAGQKCGFIMGDFSRAAINSSINTGSSIGVSCNVFGEGLLPTLFNHFSWGSKHLSKYVFEKAIADINNWKKLKGKTISAEEISVLKYIFGTTP
jgi:UDP-N-acetylglucosamine diphosphorylase/glucosamine-1-phosphate N-acetyltransferase